MYFGSANTSWVCGSLHRTALIDEISVPILSPGLRQSPTETSNTEMSPALVIVPLLRWASLEHAVATRTRAAPARSHARAPISTQGTDHAALCAFGRVA